MKLKRDVVGVGVRVGKEEGSRDGAGDCLDDAGFADSGNARDHEYESVDSLSEDGGGPELPSGEETIGLEALAPRRSRRLPLGSLGV